MQQAGRHWQSCMLTSATQQLTLSTAMHTRSQHPSPRPSPWTCPPPSSSAPAASPALASCRGTSWSPRCTTPPGVSAMSHDVAMAQRCHMALRVPLGRSSSVLALHATIPARLCVCVRARVVAATLPPCRPHPCPAPPGTALCSSTAAGCRRRGGRSTCRRSRHGCRHRRRPRRPPAKQAQPPARRRRRRPSRCKRSSVSSSLTSSPTPLCLTTSRRPTSFTP